MLYVEQHFSNFLPMIVVLLLITYGRKLVCGYRGLFGL